MQIETRLQCLSLSRYLFYLQFKAFPKRSDISKKKSQKCDFSCTAAIFLHTTVCYKCPCMLSEKKKETLHSFFLNSSLCWLSLRPFLSYFSCPPKTFFLLLFSSPWPLSDQSLYYSSNVRGGAKGFYYNWKNKQMVTWSNFQSVFH